MHYYGTRLSENISKREPEGYLLCLNVPVARTGTQEYLPEELGFPDRGQPPGTVSVFRPPEEVFSPEAMASFEGMPVTNDHPPEGVDISNIRALQKGHAHNVRRGSGENADLLLADLIITDPALITAILEEGKREISCGYTYELREENGRYIQRKIRGNHVAVVDAGRAGSRVSIKDEQPSESSIQRTDTASSKVATPHRGACALSLERGTDGISATGSHQCLAHIQPPALQHGMRRSQHQTTQPERRKNIMNKSLCKALARMAKDGDVETVAEIIGEMIDPAEPEQPETAPVTAEEPEEQPAETGETKNIIIDGDGLAGLLDRLDRIIELLAPAAADEDIDREVGEFILQALEAEEAEENARSGELTAAEEQPEPDEPLLQYPGEEETISRILEEQRAGDAVRVALKAVFPVLKTLPQKKQERMMERITARVIDSARRVSDGRGTHNMVTQTDGMAAPESAYAELGRRIMEKRNSACVRRRAGR